MKSALVLLFFGCLLTGAPPAHGGQSRHHSHGHRAHIKHSRYTRRTRHPVATVHPAPALAALPRLGAPHAITALAPPPPNAPEFGSVTVGDLKPVSDTQFRPAEKNTVNAQSLVQPHGPPTDPVRPPTELALISPPGIASSAVPPLDPLPGAVLLPQPERPAPALRFNHPVPIPLPETPAAQPSAPAAPPAPEHEDDDEPLALVTGTIGYIPLVRVNHSRPFQPFTPMRGYDIAVSGTGVFGHTITASGIQSLASIGGAYLTFHRHTDSRIFDIEAHYGVNDSSLLWAADRASPPVNTSLLSQEFTGDLLFRRHLNRARPYQALPYLGVGGGLLYLNPSVLPSQVAPTLLFDSGLDIPTDNQHLSFRFGGHMLFYRTPNFGTTAANGWTLSVQPAAGVLFHF